ncbi:UNVERIFIED_CONTAM: hypothetical protein FKN15_075464, partial [Acipenser sinensis]
QNVALLEEEEDVNQLTEYFSYEHFYVIYCKFWELDADHDLYIDQKDLARHNDHALSPKMIERIFSGAVTSIEYWFRCMDLDGDGVLSMYELEYFYEEQCQKLENMAIEPLPFEDCLCQMLDLVKPECEGKITLHDLKKCKLSHIFFDTFFNIEKYLDHEQKDPFSRDGENEGEEISDWERYAAEEYEILVAEEAANEQFDGIEYWFRCMDLDGDGVLSMYELEYFYEEQCQKLENMAIEPLPFEDCLCQMLDLVKPECEGKITLHDLKKCKMSHIFFDTFFNIEKYLDHEQKDPFSRDGENEGEEISDWERYAAEEYEILVAEEAANEQFDG